MRAVWVEELNKHGWEQMLLARLNFHRRLASEEVSTYTGISKRTVRKHLLRMVEKRQAHRDDFFGDVSVISIDRKPRRTT